jgi:hypothetical protein
MKLKDCKYGTLVVKNNGEIGMIKGITNNVFSANLNERSKPENAIPFVSWSDGSKGGIHNDNIEVLK